MLTQRNEKILYCHSSFQICLSLHNKVISKTIPFISLSTEKYNTDTYTPGTREEGKNCEEKKHKFQVDSSCKTKAFLKTIKVQRVNGKNLKFLSHDDDADDDDIHGIVAIFFLLNFNSCFIF